MPTKASFSQKNLEEYLARCHEVMMEMVYQALAALAEECVNRIRDRSAEASWYDQTGNLRSSIGFIITVDGRPILDGGFKPTDAPKGNGAEGQKTGPEYAGSIASRFASCPIALIVVAGMEYAIYVEARDNKDVLAATELWARAEWRKREPKLKARIEKRWDRLAREMNIA